MIEGVGTYLAWTAGVSVVAALILGCLTVQAQTPGASDRGASHAT